jgi:hypothetical protein
MPIPSDVLRGFNRTLTLYKQGEEVTSFANTKTMPTFSHQAKWKFSKGQGHVQLHNPDEKVVYHFATPDGLVEHGSSVGFRSSDIEEKDFGKDGTTHNAQVHRSDPGSVYFTVQDGTKNPTYTLRHVGGAKWHFEAKKQKPKTVVNVEQVKQAILKQADAPWYDPTPYLAKAITGAGSGVLEVGRSPMLSAAIAGGAGLTYDQLKRKFYTTARENQEETVMDRLKRIAIPAAGAGAVGTILHTGLPNYYP